ncbi:unnamed protein product [Echinostoma caproni]|uniref:Non-specific serine/threonine protein kinase n=1 Tax=Echinostoma caproni TaxID=27848 RepID=A0A183AI93_9TREM|nr:unnamed protein product [Echinostoma caproni]
MHHREPRTEGEPLSLRVNDGNSFTSDAAYVLRPPSFSWLTDLELVPVRVDELSSALNQSSQGDSVVRDWKLYRLLVRCALPCLPAQRMLWQLRAEARLCPSSSPHSRFRLLDQIEIGLTQRFSAVRQPDWRFHAVEDNRWFWTSALLRISLIWQLFPVELQRVVEGLSALLAGCTAVLVNTKLPVILQLAILFAQRILVDWTVDTFDLRCLDALIDWNLSGLAFPAPGLHPPINGGPPAYSNPSTSVDGNGSHMGSQRKSTTRTGSSFLVAFVHLVSEVAPSLMDWSTELAHIEPALRVSIEDILLRIQDTKTALDVWRAISHISSTEPETDDCQSTTQSQIQSILQDVDNQLIRLLQAAESTRTVVQSTAHWLRITSSSSTLSIHTEWLAPVIRFAAAFKKCASDVERKRRNGVDTAPGSTPSHRHEHRRGKNEKTHQSHNDDKPEHRRRKHRTRQLDSDGIMDDILAGLTYQPLRTDIHTKRKESLGSKASN